MCSKRMCPPMTKRESPPVWSEWLACGGRLRDGGGGVQLGWGSVSPTRTLPKATEFCQERSRARAAIPYNNLMKPTPTRVTLSGSCFAWGRRRCVDGLQTGGLSRGRWPAECVVWSSIWIASRQRLRKILLDKNVSVPFSRVKAYR